MHQLSGQGSRRAASAPRPTETADLVGGTPLVRLRRLARGGPGAPRLFAKLERANPGGSAKDRPAQRMVDQAWRAGTIGPGSTIVESSSGNLGVALAQQARARGLRFICVIDPRTPATTRRLIEAYGGQVHLVDRPDATTGDWLTARIAAVRHLLTEVPSAWWPNQYASADNAAAHAEGTMREVVDALDGEIAAVLIATSSTGTIVGASDHLRQRGLSSLVYAVDAAGSVLFGGARGPRELPGFGAGLVPPLAERARPDAVLRATDLDCVVGCRRLVDREALLMGASSGAVVRAAERVLHRFGPDDNLVLVMHDGGERYLDTVYDDAWVEEHLGCEPDRLADLVATPTEQLVA
ncbi:Cystathionine beta-synthase [metagenome]|uniref:N-(2-amino-2-carboxyethyl)-L-glutamate synthase n=1 Tax=metagenome TaxID=256318 RepID=A0A2P2C602_9ZZZZ